MFRSMPAILAGLALMAAAVPATAQQVGSVALVQVYGYETPPAQGREPIFQRDPVVSDTVLEAVRNGRIDVRFVDDTQLIVGPGATVKVDRFVYDSSHTTGDVTLNVGKGVMRFMTGRLASPSYAIRTPTATLGVRGTDFVVAVNEDGVTSVSVLSGGVQLTANGGATAAFDAGFTGVTDGGNVSITPTAGTPALSRASFGVGEPGLGQDGGSDDGESGGGDGGEDGGNDDGQGEYQG